MRLHRQWHQIYKVAEVLVRLSHSTGLPQGLQDEAYCCVFSNEIAPEWEETIGKTVRLPVARRSSLAMSGYLVLLSLISDQETEEPGPKCQTTKFNGDIGGLAGLRSCKNRSQTLAPGSSMLKAVMRLSIK
jgi:hypothetical protein